MCLTGEVGLEDPLHLLVLGEASGILGGRTQLVPVES